MTRNIRLTLSYDGTDFAGWQLQEKYGAESARTVQGEVEKALYALHGKTTRVYGAGRTDSGVHAAGQSAHFLTDMANIRADNFTRALNGLLPRDVRILRSEEAPLNFHARFDAKCRVYRYRIIAGRNAYPWERRYAMQLWRIPDIARLNALCALLRGEMDCSLFASPRDASISRFRYITHAHFFYDGGALVFEIGANAFLWKMVRCIVGTILHLEKNGASAADFARLIRSRDHKQAGTTAPPEGLTLLYVGY